MKSFGIGVAFLALVLGGCGASDQPTTPQTNVPIHDLATHKKMSAISASLGLMVPNVPSYTCSGGYQPASVMGPPSWQLTVTCVDPKLKSRSPKGTLRAGMVAIFEQPANKNATSLIKAIQMVSSTSHLGISSAGSLRVGTGRIDFGGYQSNLLWFLGGNTSWTYAHQQESGKVLVYLTGRAVSTATLKQFAQSMYTLRH